MRQVIVFIACIVAGCSSVATKDTSRQASLQATPISLCTVIENPKLYIGKIVKISARYSIVKHYDSFFTADGCTGKSTVAEGSRKEFDRSIADFNREGDKLCKARKIESLCTLDADVAAAVRIRIDTDNELVADPIHIDSYSYLPEKESNQHSP